MRGLMKVCASLVTSINFPGPVRMLAVPVTCFSPEGLRGISEMPVKRPDLDHSVSPVERTV